jgi:cobalamin biosynthesis protein CobD/CbiB
MLHADGVFVLLVVTSSAMCLCTVLLVLSSSDILYILWDSISVLASFSNRYLKERFIRRAGRRARRRTDALALGHVVFFRTEDGERLSMALRSGGINSLSQFL